MSVLRAGHGLTVRNFLSGIMPVRTAKYKGIFVKGESIFAVPSETAATALRGSRFLLTEFPKRIKILKSLQQHLPGSARSGDLRQSRDEKEHLRWSSRAETVL